MSMRVGLDLTEEKIFLELGGESGLTTKVTISANIARALAAQLDATADALDQSMTHGYLGNDKDAKAES